LPTPTSKRAPKRRARASGFGVIAGEAVEKKKPRCFTKTADKLASSAHARHRSRAAICRCRYEMKSLTRSRLLPGHCANRRRRVDNEIAYRRAASCWSSA